MKELSIEQKAKAYDNVRKKIATRFGSNVAKEIFSDYEESEDERIRKEMISWLKGFIGEEEGCGYTEDEIRERIAWLEKQSEQKPTWKPSDEQINALNYVVNLMASSERPTENDLYYNILKSLRQQLKKLKG